MNISAQPGPVWGLATEKVPADEVEVDESKLPGLPLHDGGPNVPDLVGGVSVASNGSESPAATSALLYPTIFTTINLACCLVFSPANVKTTCQYLSIMGQGQPFFGFFVAVQGICMVDLVVCLMETVALWVEVPVAACRVQLGASHSIHLSLSLTICAICIYR